MGEKRKADAIVDEAADESFPASDPPAFTAEVAIGAPPASDVDLQIFRLVPSAEAHDPRWQGRVPPGEVLVRARSAADARILAAEAELDFMEVNAKPAHGVSTEFASCFRDDKLYSVIASPDEDYSRQGPRQVLRANFDPQVLKRDDRR